MKKNGEDSRTASVNLPNCKRTFLKPLYILCNSALVNFVCSNNPSIPNVCSDWKSNDDSIEQSEDWIEHWKNKLQQTSGVPLENVVVIWQGKFHAIVICIKNYLKTQDFRQNAGSLFWYVFVERPLLMINKPTTSEMKGQIQSHNHHFIVHSTRQKALGREVLLKFSPSDITLSLLPWNVFFDFRPVSQWSECLSRLIIPAFYFYVTSFGCLVFSNLVGEKKCIKRMDER